MAVTDDDTADLLALFPSFVVEGRTWWFDVWLATEPSQPVSVTVFSGDSGALSVEPTTLTFTPGQLVHYAAGDAARCRGRRRDKRDGDGDPDCVGRRLYGSGCHRRSVDVIDNDPVDLVVDPDSLSVDEGGTASFDVTVGDGAVAAGVGGGVVW